VGVAPRSPGPSVGRGSTDPPCGTGLPLRCSLKSCQQRFQQPCLLITCTKPQRGSGTVGRERQRATLHQHNIDWLNNVMMAHVSECRDGTLASSSCDACARKHQPLQSVCPGVHPRPNVSKTPQRFTQGESGESLTPTKAHHDDVANLPGGDDRCCGAVVIRCAHAPPLATLSIQPWLLPYLPLKQVANSSCLL
jgi:hypothetical protein